MLNDLWNRVRSTALWLMITEGLGVARGPVRPTATAAPPRVSPPSRPRAQRNVPRKRRRSKSWKPNGIQECARRVRQIERGQLTASNGLVCYGASGATVLCDSHGVFDLTPQSV